MITFQSISITVALVEEMLEDIDAVEGGDSPARGQESLPEMERRHKAETRKLEGEVRALLKTAKKSTKAQIETQILRMQYDLKGRHQEEMDELENRSGMFSRRCSHAFSSD